MKIVLPIIGTAAVIVQLIRFWPFTFTALLSALVTGGVFYIACKLAWDTQKGRILLFFSFNNPICKETGDPFYGRCEKFIEESSETKTSVSFNLGGKAFYPLFLAIAFIAGSSATRIEHIRKMGQNDRRIRPREY